MLLYNNSIFFVLSNSSITMLNNLINEKFSIKQILQFFIPYSIVSLLTYSVYLMNKQMEALEQTIKKMSKTISLLQKQNMSLQNQIKEKAIELQDIHFKLQDQLQISSTQATTSANTADFLIANNAMTQFYIKTAGVLLGSVIVFACVYYISGFSFSFKAIIPTGVYELIQDNTFFFQTQKFFTYCDLDSKTDWLIKILNDKHAFLTVKPEHSPDYISVSNYLAKLHANAGTVARLTESSVESSPLFNIGTDLTTTAVDVLASPTVNSLATTAEMARTLANIM